MGGANGKDHSAEHDPGVLGEAREDLPAIDKAGRATVAAFRARMREGKQEVIDWLDTHHEGAVGYAKVLADLRGSQDDRVRLGALKIEAQLREWFQPESASVSIDARQQTVNVVQSMDDGRLAKWLEDVQRGLKEIHGGNGKA